MLTEASSLFVPENDKSPVWFVMLSESELPVSSSAARSKELTVGNTVSLIIVFVCDVYVSLPSPSVTLKHILYSTSASKSAYVSPLAYVILESSQSVEDTTFAISGTTNAVPFENVSTDELTTSPAAATLCVKANALAVVCSALDT